MILTSKIEIAIQPSVQPADWQRVATKRAQRAAEKRGIEWLDAEVFVRLPEQGRCMTKSAGFTQLVAHG